MALDRQAKVILGLAEQARVAMSQPSPGRGAASTAFVLRDALLEYDPIPLEAAIREADALVEEGSYWEPPHFANVVLFHPKAAARNFERRPAISTYPWGVAWRQSRYLTLIQARDASLHGDDFIRWAFANRFKIRDAFPIYATPRYVNGRRVRRR